MNPPQKLMLHIQKVRSSINGGIRKALLSFVHAVSAEMKAAKISNRKLAEKMKVSPPYISQVLQGQSNMSIEAMVKVAQALDCDLQINLRKRQRIRAWEDIKASQIIATVTAQSGPSPCGNSTGARPFSCGLLSFAV